MRILFLISILFFLKFISTDSSIYLYRNQAIKDYFSLPELPDFAAQCQLNKQYLTNNLTIGLCSQNDSISQQLCRYPDLYYTLSAKIQDNSKKKSAMNLVTEFQFSIGSWLKDSACAQCQLISKKKKKKTIIECDSKVEDLFGCADNSNQFVATNESQCLNFPFQGNFLNATIKISGIPTFRDQIMLVNSMYQPFQINYDLDGGISLNQLFLSNFQALILSPVSPEQFPLKIIKAEPSSFEEMVEQPIMIIDDNSIPISIISFNSNGQDKPFKLVIQKPTLSEFSLTSSCIVLPESIFTQVMNYFGQKGFDCAIQQGTNYLVCSAIRQLFFNELQFNITFSFGKKKSLSIPMYPWMLKQCTFDFGAQRFKCLLNFQKSFDYESQIILLGEPILKNIAIMLQRDVNPDNIIYSFGRAKEIFPPNIADFFESEQLRLSKKQFRTKIIIICVATFCTLIVIFVIWLACQTEECSKFLASMKCLKCGCKIYKKIKKILCFWQKGQEINDEEANDYSETEGFAKQGQNESTFQEEVQEILHQKYTSQQPWPVVTKAEEPKPFPFQFQSSADKRPNLFEKIQEQFNQTSGQNPVEFNFNFELDTKSVQSVQEVQEREQENKDKEGKEKKIEFDFAGVAKQIQTEEKEKKEKKEEDFNDFNKFDAVKF